MINKLDFKTKENWVKDEHRQYLWIHDQLPIQAMYFVNCDIEDIVCLWVKTHHNDYFVSNYFVYSIEAIKKHPLDYAIEIVDEFKHKESSVKDGKKDLPA